MQSFRQILVAACICLASGLLFVNIYTSLVDARSWAANMPSSVQAARAYFTAANPGDFFRIFSPMHQVAALLLVIACWKAGGPVRTLSIEAFLVALLADAFTFGYFYPRNEIIFLSNSSEEVIGQAVTEWAAMNWARSALVAVGLGLFLTIQNKLYYLKTTAA